MVPHKIIHKYLTKVDKTSVDEVQWFRFSVKTTNKQRRKMATQMTANGAIGEEVLVHRLFHEYLGALVTIRSQKKQMR